MHRLAHRLLPPAGQQQLLRLRRPATAAAPSAGRGFGASAATEPPSPAPAAGDSIYDRPELYDAAFGYRDFATEAAALLKLHALHCGGARPATALDLGAGPARHSVELARCGVAVTALDANPTMLAYAESLAAAAAPPLAGGVRFLRGDMRTGAGLPAGSTFDLVICLLGTFSHNLDNRAAGEALATAERHLAPGGLLVLELAHPGDLFDGTLILGDGGREARERPQLAAYHLHRTAAAATLRRGCAASPALNRCPAARAPRAGVGCRGQGRPAAAVCGVGPRAGQFRPGDADRAPQRVHQRV